MSENDAKCRIFAGLLLEKWSLVDFQSIRERKWCKMQDFRRFTIAKVSIGRFSKHKWTTMMQNGWFSRFYYCKSDHLSIFKAYVNENDAKWRKFSVLLLEKWSFVDFQSMSERKSCKMRDFRGFTIVKVSICRFSKHKWTKMMQNVGISRVYSCKSDHWSIFKAWVSENDAKCRIFADLLL